MSETDSDSEDMARARNRVLYAGAKNSLVEWTLSDEWSLASESTNIRGLVNCSGLLVTCNFTVGEINAH